MVDVKTRAFHQKDQFLQFETVGVVDAVGHFIVFKVRQREPRHNAGNNHDP